MGWVALPWEKDEICDGGSMTLSKKKLAKKRANKKAKRKKHQEGVKHHGGSSQPDDTTSGSMKAVSKRIAVVFEVDGNLDAIPSFNAESHRQYFEYLKKQMSDDYLVKGFDEEGYFDWEEEYYVAEGETRTMEAQAEYDRLRIENGASDDIYKVLALEDIDTGNNSIIVRCERVDDKKVFVFSMIDLIGCNQEEELNHLIDDYGFWVSGSFLEY